MRTDFLFYIHRCTTALRLESRSSPHRCPVYGWGTLSQWSVHECHVCVATYLTSPVQEYPRPCLRDSSGMASSSCLPAGSVPSSSAESDLPRTAFTLILFVLPDDGTLDPDRSDRHRRRHGSWDRRPKPVPRSPKRTSFEHVVLVSPLRHDHFDGLSCLDVRHRHRDPSRVDLLKQHLVFRFCAVVKSAPFDAESVASKGNVAVRHFLFPIVCMVSSESCRSKMRWLPGASVSGTYALLTPSVPSVCPPPLNAIDCALVASG